MATHFIPRNYKGESRILIIFSVKSLITTGIGLCIGSLPYLIFTAIGMGKVGVGLLIFFSLLGYVIGAFKIPTIAGIPLTKRIGGEPISEIIIRYIKFKKERKIYTYTTKEEENK